MSFVSISLENFNPGGRSWNVSRFGPSGFRLWHVAGVGFNFFRGVGFWTCWFARFNGLSALHGVPLTGWQLPDLLEKGKENHPKKTRTFILAEPLKFLEKKSESSRRLWLSEIPCWKCFPANFDAAGKFLTNFLAARNAIPAKVWAFSGKENGCWKIGRACGNAAGFSPPRPPQPSWVLLKKGKRRKKQGILWKTKVKEKKKRKKDQGS